MKGLICGSTTRDATTEKHVSVREIQGINVMLYNGLETWTLIIHVLFFCLIKPGVAGKIKEISN